MLTERSEKDSIAANPCLPPPPLCCNIMHMDQQFACGNGHQIMAWQKDGEPVDLTGYFCSICIGEIVGHGVTIDNRILAPVQVTTGE